ncbi:MAG: haloacid dehalogenase-like hydrolase [Sulfurimonas sp.]|nr:haloacid dehalogenase-like hydrolase [Sulfurimonas sp.]
MNLALFDFDGTLTKKDSLNEFLKHSVDTQTYLQNMLRFAPFFILWQLSLISNSTAKQHLLKMFFKDTNKDEFEKLAKEYSLTKIDSILRKDRFEILQKHKQDGDRVVIVSASLQSWLQPWCDKNKIELLCTQLEFIDGKVTGKFLTPNCSGLEKVNRIKEFLDLNMYETIYAYGDSSGDVQMLDIADFGIHYGRL